MRVFLAGTVQGGQASADADQSYRGTLTELLREQWPDIEVIDPTAWTSGVLDGELAREAMSQLIDAARRDERIEPGSMGQLLPLARQQFWGAARDVSTCDYCVAWLPGDGMSMGTAMEIALAHEAGVPVVAMTKNVTNLAVLSAATVIVGTLPQAVEAIACHQAK